MNFSALESTLKKNKLDVIISKSQQTRIWCAKISVSAGFLFLEQKERNLFVDGRYIEMARKHSQNVEVHLSGNNGLQDFIKNKTYKRIGIEEEYLTIGELELLKSWFPKAIFINVKAKELRIIKTEEEINNIQKACEITLNSLNSIKKFIKPGVTEKEIARKLNFEFSKNGADKNSFDTIVVSGARGALPHGKPSDKKLEKNELVTIDSGVFYKGYSSDITRTFVVGKTADKKLLEIMQIVKEAQTLGIEAIRPGINSSDIDKICRDYITEKGYGKYFVHGTGHGLGIDVHEVPNVVSSETRGSILEPGMVITVEPGIYIENLGGVRIEDDILVTKDSYKILSKIQ